MLVPAGILVLIILGAIAVDSAVVFLAQHDLENRTAAAASSIAGAAASEAEFYDSGAVVLDPALASAYTDLAFASDGAPTGYVEWSATATTEDRQVTVEARAVVRYVFAPAVPGLRSTATVRARSTATAKGG
jgi:Flp pilus assembly protein TadG